MIEANWMVKGAVLNEYLDACKNADLKTFKRDIRLNRIFEHASVEQGKAYLDLILMQTPELLRNVFTNDMQGSPVIYDYGAGNIFSPSTLQYIGVLSNLITRFGSLDGKRIVEVGGGYGGQCRTVWDVYKPDAYRLVDLSEACELQVRYLKDTNVRATSIIPDGEFDIFISNYALSEIPNNDSYIDLARRCKHGYITCNTDMVKLDWPHERIPDIITERETNYILIW